MSLPPATKPVTSSKRTAVQAELTSSSDLKEAKDARIDSDTTVAKPQSAQTFASKASALMTTPFFKSLASSHTNAVDVIDSLTPKYVMDASKGGMATPVFKLVSDSHQYIPSFSIPGIVMFGDLGHAGNLFDPNKKFSNKDAEEMYGKTHSTDVAKAQHVAKIRAPDTEDGKMYFNAICESLDKLFDRCLRVWLEHGHEHPKAKDFCEGHREKIRQTWMMVIQHRDYADIELEGKVLDEYNQKVEAMVAQKDTMESRMAAVRENMSVVKPIPLFSCPVKREYIEEVNAEGKKVKTDKFFWSLTTKTSVLSTENDNTLKRSASIKFAPHPALDAFCATPVNGKKFTRTAFFVRDVKNNPFVGPITHGSFILIGDCNPWAIPGTSVRMSAKYAQVIVKAKPMDMEAEVQNYSSSDLATLGIDAASLGITELVEAKSTSAASTTSTSMDTSSNTNSDHAAGQDEEDSFGYVHVSME